MIHASIEIGFPDKILDQLPPIVSSVKSIFISWCIPPGLNPENNWCKRSNWLREVWTSPVIYECQNSITTAPSCGISTRRSVTVWRISHRLFYWPILLIPRLENVEIWITFGLKRVIVVFIDCKKFMIMLTASVSGRVFGRDCFANQNDFWKTHCVSSGRSPVRYTKC